MEFTTNEKTTQYTNQCAYVLYYKQDRNPKDQLRRLPIRITYVSKKLQAVYFYTDAKLIPQINSMLKRINGIIDFERAPLFDDTLNF